MGKAFMVEIDSLDPLTTRRQRWRMREAFLPSNCSTQLKDGRTLFGLQHPEEIHPSSRPPSSQKSRAKLSRSKSSLRTSRRTIDNVKMKMEDEETLTLIHLRKSHEQSYHGRSQVFRHHQSRRTIDNVKMKMIEDGEGLLAEQQHLTLVASSSRTVAPFWTNSSSLYQQAA